MNMQPRWNARSVRLSHAYVLLSIAYLILAMNLPVSIYTTAGHDDALYWTRANEILLGNWLGPYSNMTLAKGPAFSLLLAVNAILGIPITLFVASWYLLACWLLVNTLQRVGVGAYVALILFAVLLFHPALFPLRIIRDNVYPALTLTVVAGVIHLAFADSRVGWKYLVPTAITMALFWTTREEGVWIIPGLLLVILMRLWHLRRDSDLLPCLLYRVFCLFAVSSIFVSAFGLMNYIKYGKFEIVDFKGQAFSRAVESLINVRAGPVVPFLPVSKEKRKQIYEVSPTFAVLRETLESQENGWLKHGCATYPDTCGDYAAGWFVWALRDAVAAAGYYDNPLHASSFYEKVRQEIDAACNSGRLTCRGSLVSLMPQVTQGQIDRLPARMADALRIAMVQYVVPDIGGQSFDPLESLQKIRRFLRNPLTVASPSEGPAEFTGWYYDAKQSWITLNCQTEGRRRSEHVQRLPSPDIAKAFGNPDASERRFSVRIADNDDCSLAVDGFPESSILLRPLLDNGTKSFVLPTGGTLYFDFIGRPMPHALSDIPFKIKRRLNFIYQATMPWLVSIGLLSYAFGIIRVIASAAKIDGVFIVATAMWCLFISRIALLSLIDISAFYAVDPLYMSAAFPILCAAAIVSLQLILSTPLSKSLVHSCRARAAEILRSRTIGTRVDDAGPDVLPARAAGRSTTDASQ